MSVKVFFNYDAPFNKEQQEHLTKLVNKWHKELKQLLPKLNTRDVVFDAEPSHKDWNTNGSSWKNKILLHLRLSYLKEQPDVEELKATFFHESFHDLQKWYMEDSYTPMEAMAKCIKEGAAVVFERTRSGHVQEHFDYSNLDVESLVEEIKGLGDRYEYWKWDSYHDEKQEPILIYRVGAYLVDKALENSDDLEIEDLATMDYKEIVRLAGYGD